MKRLSTIIQRVTSTKRVNPVPGRMLWDVENLILHSGATFGYTTFDAVDVSKPIHLGEGNVVFPEGWTVQECDNWRYENNLLYNEEPTLN
jgi:hypothetical protein